MDYPYKYLVIVSADDDYSSYEQVYLDIDDAICRVKSAEECGESVAMYRIASHSGFFKN